MSAPTRKSVELFYDVVSPYSWIAFEVMCRYQNKWNIDLKLKPFFLGGIMQGSDNKPPGFVPNKFKYMAKDLVRLSEHYKVPLRFPKNPAEVMFEKGSLSAQRLLTAVNMTHPNLTEAVSRELWMRIWNRDEDITTIESLRQAVIDGGLPKEEVENCLKSIQEQAVKDRLKQFTTEALEHGAFGSPTIMAELGDGKKEMVFGSDRFPILADILGEKWLGPLPELSKSKL